MNFHLKNSLKTHPAGFTLIELMIAIAIVGILASIAVPNYIKYKEKARFVVAITDMKLIEKKIAHFVLDNDELPDDLSEIGIETIVGDVFVVKGRQHQDTTASLIDGMPGQTDAVRQSTTSGARHHTRWVDAALDEPVQQLNFFVDRKRIGFAVCSKNRQTDILG